MIKRLAIAVRGAIVLCIPPRLAGTAGHGGVTYFVTSAPDRRVAVFVDYQNTYHRARELFGSPGDPPTMGHVHPHRLGDLLLGLGESGGPRRVPVGVRLYRGRPGIQSHQKLRLAFDRQTARWRDLPGVSVHTRPMRYQATKWSAGRAVAWQGEEKGVDVLMALHIALGARDDLYDIAVVVSADTDLLPAIEEAVRVGKTVETASWWTPKSPREPLRIPDRRLWNHRLGLQHFDQVRDDTDYLAIPREVSA